MSERHFFRDDDLAGLKTGDVVLRVNDQPFNSVEQLEERLRSQQGKPTELRIGRWNGAEYSSKTFALPASSSLQDLQLNGTLGFVVDEAVPNTPAQQADFQPGDAIIGFEGKSFTSSHELRELAQREPGTRVLLKVQRRENEATHKYDLALVLAPVPATMPVR